MIPTAKSKNFMDLSISGLHVLILTHQELHRLIERHPYRRINGGPVYEFDQRHEFDPAFFELEDEEYFDDEEPQEAAD